MWGPRVLGVLAIAAGMVFCGDAQAQTKCKPPTVLHQGSCVHPDDIKQPAPAPKPTPNPVPRPPPVVKPQPPPPPEPDPEPDPVPDPEPEPEPEVEPEPIPEPAPLPDPTPDDGDSGSSGMTTGGYVLIGVGGASVVVSLVMGALVLGRKSTIEDSEHCDAPDEDGLIRCDQEGEDAAAEGKTFSSVATATFIIGLAAVATGIALVVFDDDEDQVSLTLGPGSIGLRGRF